MPATSGYLGVENQLYRVEVHTGGTVRRRRRPDLQVVTRKRLRRVPYRGHRTTPRERQPHPDGRERNRRLSRPRRTHRAGRRGLGRADRRHLGTARHAGRRCWPCRRSTAPTGSSPSAAELTTDLSLHPYLRRWDQTSPTARTGPHCRVIRPTARTPGSNLKTGSRSASRPTAPSTGRGDYWLIPARTATGGLLWPGDAGTPRRPAARPDPLPGAPRAGQGQEDR